MARKERWLGVKSKKQREGRKKPIVLMGDKDEHKRDRLKRRRDGQDNVVIEDV